MSSVTCAYCGDPTDKPTRDHVVPSTLWGGRGFRPPHPVIVPACSACQPAYDGEAEYSRNCLVAVMDRHSHPVAERLLTGPVIRSLERNQRAVNDFFRGLRAVPKTTPSGLIVGAAPAFQIDLCRIHRVVEKIVRRMYFFKSGSRLPPNHEVRVFPGNAFWHDEGCRNLIASMCLPEHQGDDVFYCRHVRDNSGEDMTAWLLVFYGQVGFFAWTQRAAESLDSVIESSARARRAMKREPFCVYCGATEDLTEDHVPPQCLFPKPRPRLIKVPACKACHAPTSKDDEYFRMRICISAEGGDHPDAKNNFEPIFRALQRPEFQGMAKTLIKDSREVWLRTASGIYVEKTLAFSVDLTRIFRVVERTVRGLFFEETGRRLDPAYDVMVHSNDTLSGQDPASLQELTRVILAPLANRPATVIGNEVFVYRYAITADDPNVSAWALTFYRNVPFLALTAPRVDPRQKGEPAVSS